MLLDNASMTLRNGMVGAILGPNGCGKSTLFSMILGNMEIDSGSIINDGETIGYLPQELHFEDTITLRSFFLTFVSGEEEFWKAEKIISQLGLDDLDLDQEANSLSEGQKLKVRLAGVLVGEPSLLLLDEPTNHLDIDGILWFENFIKGFNGSVLMISHDRSFLDNTTDVIFEFDEHEIHTFHGNYTDYREQKQDWIEKREQLYRAQERKRKQLEQLAMNASKIKDGKKRGKALRAARKRMDREVTSSEMGEYAQYEVSNMDIAGSTHRGKLILKVEDLSKYYEDHEVFSDLNFELRGDERIWISGHNGAGKTTLLQMITHKLQPSSGSIRLGDNVSWGYFRQNQQHLPLEMKVGEFLRKYGGLSTQGAYNFLTKYNFQPDYLKTTLQNMSPGERARLSFALFTYKEYNFLILDEPTNHLDIWTKETIESALQDFSGAILLVSHDRYFVENVGIDKVLKLDKGRLEFA